jgi:hypothetical protein
MSEMVEKVARAIRAGRGCGNEFPCPFCEWGPDELTEQFDETGCIWLARAAIEAMREPTEAMARAYKTALKVHIDALPDKIRVPGGFVVDEPLKMRLRWQAMIDAALARDET